MRGVHIVGGDSNFHPTYKYWGLGIKPCIVGGEQAVEINSQKKLIQWIQLYNLLIYYLFNRELMCYFEMEWML